MDDKPFSYARAIEQNKQNFKPGFGSSYMVIREKKTQITLIFFVGVNGLGHVYQASFDAESGLMQDEEWSKFYNLKDLKDIPGFKEVLLSRADASEDEVALAMVEPILAAKTKKTHPLEDAKRFAIQDLRTHLEWAHTKLLEDESAKESP